MQPTNNNSITNENWAWTTCGQQGGWRPDQQHSLTRVCAWPTTDHHQQSASTAPRPFGHQAAGEVSAASNQNATLPVRGTTGCRKQTGTQKQTVCTCRSNPHLTKAAGASRRTTSICECVLVPSSSFSSPPNLSWRKKAAYPHGLQLHVKTHTHTQDTPCTPHAHASCGCVA